jgi:prevent-host-death family protein
MKNAGVAELKARLSGYLKHVKGGHEVLITERGLPVAKIVPLDASGRRDERRLRLAKAGLLQLARKPLPRFLLSAPRGNRSLGTSVLSLLLEERADGR